MIFGFLLYDSQEGCERAAEAQFESMEPPRLRISKKILQGPASPPAPVLYSSTLRNLPGSSGGEQTEPDQEDDRKRQGQPDEEKKNSKVVHTKFGNSLISENKFLHTKLKNKSSQKNFIVQHLYLQKIEIHFYYMQKCIDYRKKSHLKPINVI